LAGFLVIRILKKARKETKTDESPIAQKPLIFGGEKKGLTADGADSTDGKAPKWKGRNRGSTPMETDGFGHGGAESPRPGRRTLCCVACTQFFRSVFLAGKLISVLSGERLSRSSIYRLHCMIYLSTVIP
jgi:hypothetical protein